MNKTIIFISIFIGMEACNNSSIEISEVDGHNFISCNIDKIKDTTNLKLSEIAEYSQIVALEDDSRLEEEDYDIRRTFISEKYIVVIPRLGAKPALLYSRDGKFIKRLIPLDKNLGGIYAQIDDENDAIYVLVRGLKLFKFNVFDTNVLNIHKSAKNSWGFVLLDNDKILSTFYNNQNIWGCIQSIHSTKTEYLSHNIIENNHLNPISQSAEILKCHDRIVLSFSHTNDTSYYYNKKNKMLVPFLRRFSPIRSNKLKTKIKNSSAPYERVLSNKRLCYNDDTYSLFGNYMIDKHKQQAYVLDKIINDFWGELEMNYYDMINGWHYLSNNDGYFSFVYRKDQLKEEIKKQDVCNLNETTKNRLIVLSDKIEKAKHSHNIIFISKLKNK